ncbi:MAG: alpha/beta hydrolase [Geminicoccaceae bacterium]
MLDRRRLARLPLLAPLIAACRPVTVLDTLVPKDGQSVLAAENLSYGPHSRQRFDIYVPTGEAAAGGPQPLLLFVYGGAWRSGRKSDYRFAGRAFAARGYVTAVADYRLAPEVHYPDFLVDCGQALAAFRATAAGYGGDPSWTFLAGHSAGAYNAVMLALAPEIAEAAGYEQASISAVAGIAGPYDFLPLEIDSMSDAFGAADDLRATQPVNRVAASAPPMILLTGTADREVVPGNADSLAAELLAAGVPVEVVRYAGVGHNGALMSIARPFRGHADILGDVDGFFTRVMAGAPPFEAARRNATRASRGSASRPGRSAS